MGTTKPRYGVPASYWIPEFKFDADLRKGIAAMLGKAPRVFYQSLEIIISDFIAWNEYQKDAPTLAHVQAALDDVGSWVRGLADRLTESTGLDGRTRQLIEQTAIRYRIQVDVIESAETALTNLHTAIELTRDNLKEKVHKGRKRDTKTDFASDIFELFERFKLNPKARRGSSFENCLDILLIAAGANTGECNVHKLALAAKRHPRIG